MRRLSSLFLAFLIFSSLAFAQPGASQATDDKQDSAQLSDEAVETSPDPNPEAAATSLQRITDLEMLFSETELVTVNSSTSDFAEIVNPFKVRKRGRFYGSVYLFHRNDNLDARNFFDPVGEPLPEFKRNQFGGSFGSLITRKLTAFGTYDGLRINRGSTLLSHIPTPEMKRGDFGSLATPLTDPFTGEAFGNNRIPDSLIHPVSRALLNLFPEPNRSDPDRNYVNNLPLIDNEDTFTGRIDYDYSDATKIFGQYRLSQSNGVNVSELPSFGSTSERSWQNLSVDVAKNFNPTLISSLRLNLNRNVFTQLSQNVEQAGLLESLGIFGISPLDELDEGYPEFRMDGYATLGLSGRNRSPRTYYGNDFGLSGTVTYTPGDHRLSFGGQVELSQINNNRSGGLRRGQFEFSGTYTGDGFADFLLGIPDSASRAQGFDRADIRRHIWRVSVRDDWKINSKFDLSLSLAYNYFSPYSSVHDNVSTFTPLVFDPPADGELVVMGSEDAARLGLGGLGPGEAVYPDRNDWAPGIGLAYSPFGSNRLVIRSSYQTTYDPIDSRDALDFLGRNYPFYFVEQADSPSDSPDLDLSDPFRAVTPTELTIRGFDPRIRNAYVQEWQLALQAEILRNWVLQVTYAGQKGTRLPIEFPANVPLPDPGAIQDRRPNPKFGRFEILSSRGSSIGHRLEAEVEKRFSSGFSLQSGFTWNRTFSDRFFRDPSNPRNLRAERALEGFFSPKRFFADYIFDLPFGPDRAVSTAWAGKLQFLLEGWRLSGRTNILGGRPFNPRLSGDPNNDGVSGDRPDRIGSGQLEASEQSIDRWFATEDFAEPGPYTFGNSGRNILLTPPRQTWDISLVKRTRLGGEGKILEFRIQFFNAFNNTNFEEPEETFGTSSFGQIFGAQEAREIEIALKYSF